jgi:hypothetical protein
MPHAPVEAERGIKKSNALRGSENNFRCTNLVVTSCFHKYVVYLPMVLQPFCCFLVAFSVSYLYTQSVGLFGRGTSRSQGRYLQMKTQTQNKRTQIFILWVGFEPTTPALKGAKTALSLDRAATVIGRLSCTSVIIVNFVSQMVNLNERPVLRKFYSRC